MKALVDDLTARGVRLRLNGDQVEFVGPRGAMTPELLRRLREHKADLRDYLLLERKRADGEADALVIEGDTLALDPDRLIAEILSAEGATDLGPDGADLHEALGIYIDSLEHDVRPHGIGRIYLHERILRTSLRARARLARVQQPGDRPTRAPLIVCGLPRSGTTLLHRLLALADDAAALPLWQLLEPLPPPDGQPDLRYDHAVRNVMWLGSLAASSLDAQHYVRPDLPDECAHLLRTSFRGSMPWQAPAFAWLDWSLRADALPAYRVWAAFLRQLEPTDVRSRLVLKDPFHMAYLREIHAVCPDAMIVQTHRDPIEVVPSFHKLCTTMHSVLAPNLDLPRIVAAQTEWLAWMIERNVEARAHIAPQTLIDIDYRNLVRDPLGTVARIHEAFALPLTDAHAARMRTHLTEHPQRKHGANPYSAEQFGQHPDEIAERFAGYRNAWGMDRVQSVG